MTGTLIPLYVAVSVSGFALCFSYVLWDGWVLAVAGGLVAAWTIGLVALRRRKPSGFTRLQVNGGRVFLDTHPVEAEELEVREYIEGWKRQAGVGVRVRLTTGWEESRYWLDKADPEQLAAALRAEGLTVTVTRQRLRRSGGMGGGGPAGAGM